MAQTGYESAALTAELRAPRMLSRAVQATSDFTLLAFGGATMVDVPVFSSVLTRAAAGANTIARTGFVRPADNSQQDREHEGFRRLPTAPASTEPGLLVSVRVIVRGYLWSGGHGQILGYDADRRSDDLA